MKQRSPRSPAEMPPECSALMSSFPDARRASPACENGPDPLLRADGRLNGTRIKTRKARRPSGHRANFACLKEILLTHALTHGSNGQVQLPSVAVVAIRLRL